MRGIRASRMENPAFFDLCMPHFESSVMPSGDDESETISRALSEASHFPDRNIPAGSNVCSKCGKKAEEVLWMQCRHHLCLICASSAIFPLMSQQQKLYAYLKFLLRNTPLDNADKLAKLAGRLRKTPRATIECEICKITTKIDREQLEMLSGRRAKRILNLGELCDKNNLDHTQSTYRGGDSVRRINSPGATVSLDNQERYDSQTAWSHAYKNCETAAVSNCLKEAFQKVNRALPQVLCNLREHKENVDATADARYTQHYFRLKEAQPSDANLGGVQDMQSIDEEYEDANSIVLQPSSDFYSSDESYLLQSLEPDVLSRPCDINDGRVVPYGATEIHSDSAGTRDDETSSEKSFTYGQLSNILKPLVSLNDEKYFATRNAAKINIACPIHIDEPVQLYCHSCDAFCLCALCSIHGIHRTHHLEDLQVAWNTIRNEGVMESIEKLEDLTSDVKAAREIITTQWNEWKRTIELQKRNASVELQEVNRRLISEQENCSGMIAQKFKDTQDYTEWLEDNLKRTMGLIMEQQSLIRRIQGTLCRQGNAAMLQLFSKEYMHAKERIQTLLRVDLYHGEAMNARNPNSTDNEKRELDIKLCAAAQIPESSMEILKAAEYSSEPKNSRASVQVSGDSGYQQESESQRQEVAADVCRSEEDYIPLTPISVSSIASSFMEEAEKLSSIEKLNKDEPTENLKGAKAQPSQSPSVVLLSNIKFKRTPNYYLEKIQYIKVENEMAESVVSLLDAQAIKLRNSVGNINLGKPYLQAT